MIQRTDAIDVCNKNIDRTNSLIAAMEKIGAYNRLYQMKVATRIDSQFANTVSKVQKEELSRIEKSCSEHAIISLSTVFETYYKELLQQLLFLYPEFFLSRQTKYTDSIQELIEGREQFSYEHIELKLNLRSRFDYYKFFQAYSISLLEVKEVEFIEYLYVKRNNFVH